jgi:excisionase family DNA binding protein
MLTHEKAAPMCSTDVPAGWLTTDEIANLARCSRETVIRSAQAGEMVGAWKRGSVWLIPRQVGIDWAANYVPYEGLRRKE